MERGWRVPLSSHVVAELLLSLEFSSSLGLSKPALTKLTWSCSSRVDDEEDEKQRLENQLSLLLVAHQHCPPVAGSFKPASKITKLEDGFPVYSLQVNWGGEKKAKNHLLGSGFRKPYCQVLTGPANRQGFVCQTLDFAMV